MNMDIVLDLTGTYTTSLWSLPEHWKSKAWMVPKRIIKMGIPDMKAPWDVDEEFWEELWDDLVVESAAVLHPLKVLILCFGGHGRTGTVISALVKASKLVVPNDDIIDYVRRVYCNKAIESNDQLNYLECMGINTVGHEVAKGFISQPSQSYQPASSWKGSGAVGKIAVRKEEVNYSEFNKVVGGMSGRDGKWYNSHEINTMSDKEYNEKFV